jgi:hypothetical protein
MTHRPCRNCGAPASRWSPWCTQCDSLAGVPIAAWVILAFLAVGLYAMARGVRVR